VRRLDVVLGLRILVRKCHNRECQSYNRPYRPEAELRLALPKGEFGLDVIALVGSVRFGQHKSSEEIHALLRERGVDISPSAVTDLIYRYEEFVALRLEDKPRLQERLRAQGYVVLSIDGLQPDVGQEVLWVVRDCIGGDVLLARALLSATEADLATLLEQVKNVLPVPVRGIVSDGQVTIRNAAARVFPGVAHQLCQFHYLREAARPVYEADRHAKKELKKRVRGVRPIERAVEERTDPEAKAIRQYCLAVRSSLTDDGPPPLASPGLKLRERLSAISGSLHKVEQKRGNCPES
jgi:hypothetical protein